MATPPSGVNPQEPYHIYHAEAHVLGGELVHPIKQPVGHGARALLKDHKDSHINEHVTDFNLEGLIRVKAGHTRVSGTKIHKKDLWGRDHSGWITLSTSILEGLNVFEVVTADRVVAQVSTEHLDVDKQRHVPKVTFLGTRFENLKISGYPVKVELDLGLCGEKPPNDTSYLADQGFLDRVRRQTEAIANIDGLPTTLKEGYGGEIGKLKDLKVEKGKLTSLKCSLVKNIEPIPLPGVRVFGNMIYVPDFGIVSLAELEVGADWTGERIHASNYFELQMLNMRLGCVGGGSVKSGGVKSNGQTGP